MSNFAKIEVGSPNSWTENSFPVGDITLPGKRFIKQDLGLHGCEMSINSLKPGEGMPALHRHKQNEEVYIFLQGTGQFIVDGEQFPVGPGSIVRVDPAGARAWKNDGTTELQFIVLQTDSKTEVAAGIVDGELLGEPLTWA